jgi:ATP-dependent protease ClpP protease subunit
LIHQLSGEHWGTHEQFVDQMVLQSMLMEQLVRFYVDGSKLPATKVRSLLQRESWFDAQQALESGLIDEIY